MDGQPVDEYGQAIDPYRYGNPMAEYSNGNDADDQDYQYGYQYPGYPPR